MPLGVRVRNLAFRLSKAEASFTRRGFPGQASPTRAHLEYVIETFVTGFNLALETPDHQELTTRLDRACPAPYLGFGYEGVGLWLSISDLLLPWTPSRTVAPAFVITEAQIDELTQIQGAWKVVRVRLTPRAR